MNDTIIEVRGLTKTFKKIKKKEGFLSSIRSLVSREVEHVNSVSDVNLSIRKGEIRGLIGPNGAGKSTTIKMMSGILHPSEGTVNVLGFTPWLERERFVRHLGVLFGQKSQLWWDLPPIDTFALNKEMYRIPDEKYKERMAYFKELLQIGHVVNQPVRTLSLGERMKCELVCALLHEPALIFLDEPTIGLDIVSKETIRRFIKQMNKEQGTTFLVTTHDLADLENLCDNVTIINKGKVVFDDSMETLSTYFANSKIIEVKFNKPLDPSKLEGYNVIAWGQQSAQIEIDLTKNDIKRSVYEILDRFQVADINITNIPIEQVIKHIYSA
ncbi:ABC-2 type transport system ATP-binding protein [Paenibacillus sophorae]|uniref:ABC-2 type transport system ATP-binding protein n=1 Tax=Paenibacillus sophorae TaxID=1333845 RepID=A0A1H8N9A0_9BACL|nr:ATP-binding cassette domain-containing protein [Paenibacillus sophorae]QWU14726.1 ATP-binding cassette domain-containing protein [Paenibacillus sophorae]SEO26132.1 ABC-2 type transport system ATP-binding protein [Paenibacillus sophorae]